MTDRFAPTILLTTYVLMTILAIRAAAAAEWWSMRDRMGGIEVAGPAGWASWRLTQEDAGLAPVAATVALDAAKQRELEDVMSVVHGRVERRNDPVGRDIWRALTGPGVGDCEDFVLTYRNELIARGWPRGALDVAIAITERGEPHAVLAVDTDRGTLVLDNRRPAPTPWRALPYRWVGMEQAGTALWRPIFANSPAVASSRY